MSSSLALSGNDTFVARVIPEKRPQGVSSRTNKRLSGVGGPPKWRNRIVSVLAIMLLFIGVTASIFTQTQRSAQANWFTDGIRDVFCGTPAYFNEPVGWQNGLSSLGIGSSDVIQDGLSGLQPGNSNFLDTRKTAYDQFGMSGATWTVYSGEKDDAIGEDRVAFGSAEEDLRVSAYESECIPVVGIVTTYMANTIFSFTKFLTSVSGWIITQAYDPDWVDGLNDMTARVITGEDANGTKVGSGLKDTLYLEFLNLVILFGALWLFYTGVVKRKTTEATTGAMWMVGAVIAGSLLVYNPSFLPNLTNDITSRVASAVLVGTAGTTADIANVEGAGTNSGTNICYSSSVDNIGSTSEDRRASTLGGVSLEERRIEARRDFVISGANCQMWRAFVYEPWVVGQFGVGSEALYEDLGELSPPSVNLGGDTTVNNWALYQMSQQVISPTELAASDQTVQYQQNRDNWYKVVDGVASPEGNSTLYAAWSGSDSGGSRLGIATASVVASSFGIIVTSVLAMGMLVYSVAAAILMFVSVVFLLLGAHPGMGRRMAMRWFEMYVGAVLKKVILSVMLAMMLAFYTAILSTVPNGWGTAVIAIIAVSVAILMYRKELLETVSSSINFGGSGFSNAPTERAGETFKGVATGAAVGLGMGGFAGAKVAGGIMKSGVGTSGSRVAAATRATAAGATKGAVRTGFRGAMAGNSRAGAALAMSNAMGQNVGGQAAQGVADKHAGKFAPPISENAPITRSQGDRFTKNHERYMRDWNRNQNNPQWQEHIKKSYGLDHVPNPYEQAFDGYKKDPSTWTSDDVPRPLVEPTSNTEESPMTGEIPTGSDSSHSNDNGPSGLGSGSGSGSAPSGGATLPVRRPTAPQPQEGSSQAPQPQRTPQAVPRPTPPRERTYTNEAERRMHEAEDRELQTRRERQLNGANNMPQRSSRNATPSRPEAPKSGGNKGKGRSGPPPRPTPPKE